MGYATPHNLITWFGDGWAQQEEWQFGLRLDGAPATATLAQMTSLENALLPIFNSSDGGISEKARLLGVKQAQIGTDGLYIPNSNSVEKLLASPKPGSVATTAYPQISYCITLQSARSRGLASKGRIYPPAVAFVPLMDGRILQAVAIGYGDLFKAFILAVNAVGLGTVSVMSKGSSVGATPGVGVTEPVTSLRVGRVADTQRRRRSDIAELHVTVPLA